jgi:phenylacetic acid degradation operon negative regulatory protein
MKRDGNARPGRRAEPLLDRPLSARSLVASLLLRSRPPRMRAARLVQWCGLFGISEGTTRTALSRMAERGELLARDGVYELAGRVQGRRGSQDWSLEPVLRSWDGSWRVAIVTPGSRPATDRSALRDALRRMRFATVREGVWTRPDNLPTESAPAEAWRAADSQCTWWSGRPDDDPVALAAALFAAGEWARRAVALEAHLATVTSALAETPEAPEGALAGAFVAGAASLAHLRGDPLLPDELVADASAGAALRRAYRAYEDEFSRALRGWFLER